MSETRDIMVNGVKVGELTLPDGTSEAVWTQRLAEFVPANPSMAEIINEKLLKYQKAAPDLLRELYVANTLAGITVEQSDAMFDAFADVVIRIREGTFPTALHRLQQKLPVGFVTQDLLDSWIEKIESYINA